MGCCGGCCGPPSSSAAGSPEVADVSAGQSIRATSAEPTEIVDTCRDRDSDHFSTAGDGAGRADSCCDEPQAAGCRDSCCVAEAKSVKPEADSCANSCCQEESESSQDVGCSKSCCQAEKKPVPAVSCTDGCCQNEKEGSAQQDCADSCPTDDISCKEDCCHADVESVKSNADSCADSCCQEEKERRTPKGACMSGCCQAKEKPTPAAPCMDSCCQGERSAAGCDSDNESCCSDCESAEDAKTVQTKDVCKDACCEKTEPTLLVEDRPSCCQGKPSPCCDTSCIDRLALRECKMACGNGCTECTESTDGASCDGGKTGHACAGHARKMRRLYAAKLEALGCICRTLLQMGLESCCDMRARSERSSLDRRRGGRKTRAARSGSSKSSKSSRSSNSIRSCSSLCDTSGGKSRLGKGKTARTDCCKPSGSCCGPGRVDSGGREVDMTVTSDKLPPDLEAGSDKEHVVLSISGMTCTGCETKLRRSLGALPAVHNLKTSLVLTRAEFDLVGRTTAADVIKHLQRTTEFTCERLTTQGARLDLVVPPGGVIGDAATLLASQPWPDGVTEVRVLDKQTATVAFDPDVVGARDLFHKSGWAGRGVQLAPPRADPSLDAGRKHVRHLGVATAVSAVLTVPVLVMAWAPLPKHEMAYGAASLALATVVQAAIAGPFYPKAIKSLVFSRVIEMDLLIVLSTSAAYVFSVVSFGFLAAGQPLSTGEFFETSTLLVTLIMVGRFVGALARQKAVESISMGSLQTSRALLVETNTATTTDIDARLLQYGDAFKVPPDSRIPTDGSVLRGTSEVDESMVTGESLPVAKKPGSSVVAGSLNGPGVLVVRLTRLPGDNTISTLVAMVDEAKLSKPRIQGFADRVASYFVPVVVALAAVVFVVWILVGTQGRHQSASEATIQAVTYAITVLIVSCPCAIGLAVPMVVVIASGVAAEHGVIFRSADSIESAYKTAHVVLDKTGTLTEGRLSVSRELYLVGANRVEAAAALLGLVADVKHPVSRAVAAHLRSQGVVAAAVRDVQSVTGKGVQGRSKTSGAALRAGNAQWLHLTGNADVQSVMAQGYTVFCFAIDGAVAAVFGLEDTMRPDAESTVEKLRHAGVAVHILSGDDAGAVNAVAARLHIPEAHTRARCSPGDKQAYIQDLLTLASGTKSSPVVLFCGDGTNDAVALAQATIGVHMQHADDYDPSACATADVAQAAADIVLMRPHLAGLLTIVGVSRLAMRRIAFNFAWSAVYNVVAVLLAAGAFVHARLPPAYAGLGELVSVLPVIAAAVLLRWAKV